MKTSIKLISLMLLAVAVSACSSAPSYKPANGYGYGYEDAPLGDDRYRVSFKARGDDRSEAMDYALLRAAELTLLEGYDWFVITDRETEVVRGDDEPFASIGSSYDREVVRSCGLLGCTTSTRPTRTSSFGVNAGKNTQEEVETILEIRIGQGEKPEGIESYDALEVSRELNS